jgi:hypothetical protein
MRILAVAFLLFAVALAGCTQGDPGGGKSDFKQTCPSWIKGLSTATFSGPGWFHPNGTNFDSSDSIGGGGLGGFQGHPVDQVELSFYEKQTSNGTRQQFLYIQDGILTVQFSRNDTGAPLKVYDTSKGPAGPGNPAQDSLSWSGDADGLLLTNFTLHVDLAAPGDTPAPTGVNAYWTFVRNLDGNQDTASFALRDMTAYFWYRTCNSDGSDAVWMAGT